LIATACSATSICEVAPTFGGFSHRSAVLLLDERRVVAKAAESEPKRADLRHEARVLDSLHGRGLPVAPLLALAENERWSVEVLGFVPGTPGLRLLADTPAVLAEVYAALGALLARFHCSEPRLPHAEALLAERAETQLRALPALHLGAELQGQLGRALAHPAWHAAAPVLVQGDAGLHNILWDGAITALLDWEWSGYGSPLIDITWVYWTICWRGLAPDVWHDFLGGYGRGAAIPQLNASELRALALGQIAGILGRVQFDRGARAEWQRRAYWTLALDFSHAAR
jgi:Ser/Thr protein kinase RdoA (MazF antagonist)